MPEYVTPLGKTLVIDDTNWRQHAGDFAQKGIVRLRGRIPRDYSKYPEGSVPFCRPFDLPLIPRDEWRERIEEIDRTESGLRHLRKQSGMKSLDQDGTNYCWCNGVVTAMTLRRISMGLPYVELSPASVAAPIKNYRNQGGWGGEAIEYIAEKGICEVQYWPANAISRKYDNAESQANRKLHVIPDWLELRRRDFDQLMTSVLTGIPVAVGYNWWSHEVCAIDGVAMAGGRFGIWIKNSWGDDYGENGEAVLNESKGTPDDAVAPLFASSVG